MFSKDSRKLFYHTRLDQLFKSISFDNFRDCFKPVPFPVRGDANMEKCSLSINSELHIVLGTGKHNKELEHCCWPWVYNLVRSLLR